MSSSIGNAIGNDPVSSSRSLIVEPVLIVEIPNRVQNLSTDIFGDLDVKYLPVIKSAECFGSYMGNFQVPHDSSLEFLATAFDRFCSRWKNLSRN